MQKEYKLTRAWKNKLVNEIWNAAKRLERGYGSNNKLEVAYASGLLSGYKQAVGHLFGWGVWTDLTRYEPDIKALYVEEGL